MGFKKRECIELVELKKENLLSEIKAKYKKDREEFITMLLSEKGYIQDLSEIQVILNNSVTKFRSLALAGREDLEIRHELMKYGSFLHNVNKYEGPQKLYNDFVDSCKFEHPTLVKLLRDKDRLLEEVKSNYNTVIYNCENFKSGKEVAEYLKELGFDLSSLEEQKVQHMTSLVAQIDTSKLFMEVK